MIKGNIMNKTNTRRKSSMLQESLYKIKYFIVLAVLLVLPVQAMASDNYPYVTQTDTGSDRIVAFWDMRGRESFVQVTNTSSEKINIHVQIFDIMNPLSECFECNFNDMLTPNDTHVYDMQGMMTNQIFPPFTPMAPRAVCGGITGNSFGFMVITFTGVTGGGNVWAPLIGMFRVIDDLGYEYRANAPAEQHEGKGRILGNNTIVNFSLANGNLLSDLVGIVYATTGDPTRVEAGPGIGAAFDPIMSYDDGEHDTSCPPTLFSCAEITFDRGIDFSVPNSAGQINHLCLTAQLDAIGVSSAWLDMPFAGFLCRDENGDSIRCIDGQDAPYTNVWFHGLVGLNNGDGTGSIDSWWQEESYQD